MAKVIITVAKGGTATLKVEGVSGQSCTDLTKGLERALGARESQEYTSDYYAEEQSQDLKVGGGW